MRDFAARTSRYLTAAGVPLSAVVHPELREQVATGLPDVLAEIADYAALFFGLVVVALVGHAMGERTT